MGATIIAEVAQGYMGNPHIAHLLADAALKSGADGVKYQCVYADELAVPGYRYYELFRQLEMNRSVWKEIVDKVHAGGKAFYFDIFGEKGVALATELGVQGVKIHGTDFFNTDLIRAALGNFPQVLVSLGGIRVEELVQFLDAYHTCAKGQICYMFGYQAEPTPMDKNNLMRLNSLRGRFPSIQFGFMDHVDGGSEDAQTLSLLSLPMGVSVIEKHISLDRELTLEDNVSALTPSEFRAFVYRIRRHEAALGSGDLDLTEEEKNYRTKVLKVVVANREIRKNEMLADDAIVLKRPVEMVPDVFFRKEEILGCRIKQGIGANQVITKEMILCES